MNKKSDRVIHLLLMLAALGLATPSVAQDTAIARPAYRETLLTGFTRARATLPLVAETSGKVLSVTADIGSVIDHQGLFAELDPTFIELELEANRVAQEQLRSRIEYDTKEVGRHRTLAGQGSIPQSTLDKLELALRSNRLELKSLEVQERVLEERLTRTRIPAPPGWRVTQRIIEPGQRVNAGAVVGEVADFSVLLVPFALSPEQLAALKQYHSQLTLYLPDLDQNLPVTVHRTNPGFDPATRKIAVEFALSEGLNERRGGLRTQLKIRLPERTGAVMLPASAVEESYDEYWVTRDNGQRLRVVLLGKNGAGDKVRVTSPHIKSGDRFAIPATAAAPAQATTSGNSRDTGK
jgi:RND family efflux transporter MFP subunit